VLYLLIALAICLLVPWLSVLLLQLTPAPSAPPDDGGSRSPTVRSYQWVNLVLLPVFLVSMFGLAALWALVFNFLGNEHAKTFPPGVFVFVPPFWLIFAVPAIFLGIFSSAAIIEPFTRILLGRRYGEYRYWEQARLGMQGPAGVERFGRQFTLLARALGLGLGLWVLLAMNWYARLNENEVAIKPLFGIQEQLYPYSRVEQIVLTSHLRVKDDAVPREGLHLRFDDGQTWSTGQTFRLPETPEERNHLLEFLVQKTGKPLTPARLIENVPGW
jgi:hypothetical protein